ncbi:hypothetical protein ScalyP_jg4721 [Parmales sp. scaly parma]|nr:hypothetical protein ScalyP_jg4721 [Parmales sp. scaly parma]
MFTPPSDDGNKVLSFSEMRNVFEKSQTLNDSGKIKLSLGQPLRRSNIVNPNSNNTSNNKKMFTSPSLAPQQTELLLTSPILTPEPRQYKTKQTKKLLVDEIHEHDKENMPNGGSSKSRIKKKNNKNKMVPLQLTPTGPTTPSSNFGYFDIPSAKNRSKAKTPSPVMMTATVFTPPSFLTAYATASPTSLEVSEQTVTTTTTVYHKREILMKSKGGVELEEVEEVEVEVNNRGTFPLRKRWMLEKENSLNVLKVVYNANKNRENIIMSMMMLVAAVVVLMGGLGQGLGGGGKEVTTSVGMDMDMDMGMEKMVEDENIIMKQKSLWDFGPEFELAMEFKVEKVEGEVEVEEEEEVWGEEVIEVTVEEPIVSEVAVEEPIVDEPIVSEPIVEDPIVSEPIVSKAVEPPIEAEVASPLSTFEINTMHITDDMELGWNVEGPAVANQQFVKVQVTLDGETRFLSEEDGIRMGSETDIMLMIVDILPIYGVGMHALSVEVASMTKTDFVKTISAEFYYEGEESVAEEEEESVAEEEEETVVVEEAVVEEADAVVDVAVSDLDLNSDSANFAPPQLFIHSPQHGEKIEFHSGMNIAFSTMTTITQHEELTEVYFEAENWYIDMKLDEESFQVPFLSGDIELAGLDLGRHTMSMKLMNHKSEFSGGYDKVDFYVVEKEKDIEEEEAVVVKEDEEQEQEQEQEQEVIVGFGTRVLLHSLKAAAYNGLEGAILNFDKETNRFTVEITQDDGAKKSLALKGENLVLRE